MQAAFRSIPAGSLHLAAGAVLLWCWAGPLVSQEIRNRGSEDPRPRSEDPRPRSEDPRSLAEQVRADVDATSLRWLGTARARFSTPLEFSVGVGALVARLPDSHDCVEFCEYRGLVLQAEPGTAGGQLGVGFARLMSRSRPASPFLTDVYVGWGARAVVLRTWGDSGLDPRAQTLAGVEAQFTLVRFSFSAGVLRRISSSHDDADRFVYTAGIGWGF